MPPTRLEHIVGSTIAFLETAMTILFTRAYGLVPRGGAGLACDDDGVALGPLPLVEAVGDASGRRLYHMRPIEEIAQAFRLAYGGRTGRDRALPARPRPDRAIASGR